MLLHLGEPAAAKAIQNALVDVYTERGHMTADQGGTASTDEFTDYLCDRVQHYAAGISAATFRL